MSVGFPEASVSFNRGQDLLYRQFNDIDVYVEDTGKERLYYQLFKLLLPGIKLAKIFPLNGKENVVADAQANNTNKRKVYLVDLDFDEILGRKQTIRNLIYLQRYSIENYFVDEEAIKEQIRERKPSIRDAEIAVQFDYDSEVNRIAKYLKKPALAAIVVQRYGLGIPYPAIDLYEYTTYYNTGVYAGHINNFLSQVETVLKNKDGRFTLAAKIKAEEANTRNKRMVDYIPGKWMLNLIKGGLHGKKLIYQKSENSFAYSLAKDINVGNLAFIASEIVRIRS